MSITKRIWLEHDPAYADVRARFATTAQKQRDKFRFRVPLRRLNTWSQQPRWDPLWPVNLRDAANEQGATYVNINDGMFFLSEDQRSGVLLRAEIIWQEKMARHKR